MASHLYITQLLLASPPVHQETVPLFLILPQNKPFSSIGECTSVILFILVIMKVCLKICLAHSVTALVPCATNLTYLYISCYFMVFHF